VNPILRSLLDAILESPDDDGLRLVYADALEDDGQRERAEFIRVQVELAKTPEPAIRTPGSLPNESDEQYEFRNCESCLGVKRCRYHVLQHRERELLGGGSVYSWFVDKGPITTRTDWHMACGFAGRVEWNFVRGFVDHITCTAADWLQHADAILRDHPVREVRLTTMPLLRSQNDPHNDAVHVWLDGSSTVGQFALPPLGAMHGSYGPAFRESCTRSLLKKCWPRITTFHLPGLDARWDNDAGNILDNLRAVREQVMRDA